MYTKVNQSVGLGSLTDLLTAGAGLYQQYTQYKTAKQQTKEVEAAKQQAAQMLQLQATAPVTQKVGIVGIPTLYVLLGGGALLALMLIMKR